MPEVIARRAVLRRTGTTAPAVMAAPLVTGTVAETGDDHISAAG